MVFGIISIIIGAILIIVNLVRGIETVNQQIIQYLGFLISTVLVIGGIILISIKKYIDRLELSIYSLKDIFKKDEYPSNSASLVSSNSTDSQTKKCKQCIKRVGADLTRCPFCGSTEFFWD